MRYAINHVKKDDLIVIVGKGHENYQEIKGVRYPLDDRRIVQEELDGGVCKYNC